jgi:hypothetical protein
MSNDQYAKDETKKFEEDYAMKLIIGGACSQGNASGNMYVPPKVDPKEVQEYVNFEGRKLPVVSSSGDHGYRVCATHSGGCWPVEVLQKMRGEKHVIKS